jgi:hypothetical protein
VPSVDLGRRGLLGAELSHGAPGDAARRVTRAALGLEVTSDPSAVEKSMDPDVLGKVEQIETAVAVRTATAAYQAGDQGAALKVIGEAKKKAKDRAAVHAIPAKAMAPVFDKLDEAYGGMSANEPTSPAAEDVAKDNTADAWNMSR